MRIYTQGVRYNDRIISHELVEHVKLSRKVLYHSPKFAIIIKILIIEICLLCLSSAYCQMQARSEIKPELQWLITHERFGG